MLSILTQPRQVLDHPDVVCTIISEIFLTQSMCNTTTREVVKIKVETFKEQEIV